MDPITLIVTALATGAAAALKDGAADAIKAGYERLRDAVKNHLADSPDGELALDRHEKAPEKWEGILKDELTESGAGDNAGILEAAQALMKQMDAEGVGAGKYNVSIQNGQGVQVGDGNTQTNTFN